MDSKNDCLRTKFMLRNCKTMRRLFLMLCVITIQLPMVILPASAADIIGPDDLLRIAVYGHDDLKTETRVAADGRLTFPLIGEVVATGKSSIELERVLAAKLSEGGFIHSPQVSVVVLEHVSQYVSVLGYVNKPGRYPLESSNSIVDVIAMAGGVSEAGDKKVLLTRIVDSIQQKFELNLRDYLENPEITPAFKMQQGDSVYVPKAPMFYIYGQVQRPGGYPLEPDLSIVKALSIGGGLTPRGTESGIIVKRKDAKGVLQEIEVELVSEVLKDDVIYVGERWF
jgi:polysaccharide biosynthesis/export protein